MGLKDEPVKIEVGEYPKNTRYTVEKGTRYVQVTLDIPYSRSTIANRAIRTHYSGLGIQIAASVFEREHGQVIWDLVSISVGHVTSQVLVEFRIEET